MEELKEADTDSECVDDKEFVKECDQLAVALYETVVLALCDAVVVSEMLIEREVEMDGDKVYDCDKLEEKLIDALGDEVRDALQVREAEKLNVFDTEADNE